MKALTISLALTFALIMNAKAQTDTLVITLKNSQTEKIAVSDIKLIKFENISGVEEQSQQINNLAITGNYPNPFAEETSIEFEIARAGNVGIVIYNNSGEQIQTLKCGNCQPGKNALQWNCLNKNNNRVQSGVYYYEVRFGKEVQARKMIVLK